MSNIPPSSICWEYKWRLKVSKNTMTMSPFIDVHQLKAIRLALEFSPCSQSVYCFVNNIQQVGFALKAVTFSYDGDRMVELKPFIRNSRLIFYSTYNILGSFRGHLNFLFHFYVEGSVGNYVHQRFDNLLKDQLWEAAVFKQMTDVEFVFHDRVLFAHKFVITARSPVLRAMFRHDMVEARTGRIAIQDVDPDVFEQFLRFLYTGELDQQAGEDLLMVAEKYLVETLVSLCRSAVAHKSTPEETMACAAAFQFKEAFSQLTHHKINRLSPHDERCFQTEGFTVICEMHMNETAEIEDGKLEWDFHQGLFHFELESTVKFLNRQTFRELIYRCIQAEESDWEVTGVDLCLVTKTTISLESLGCAEDPKLSMNYRYKKLLPVSSKKNSPGCNFMKMFTTQFTESVLPSKERLSTIKFIVHLNSTAENITYQLRDSLYAEELWSTVVNREWTDMEFLVGDRVFGAHRAVLASRCPALATLAYQQMSKVGPIRIHNMEPVVFEELLYFVYTGLLRNGESLVPFSLLQAAKTFKVDTLVGLLVAQ